MAYLLSRMVRLRPGHGSHAHTPVRLLGSLNPREDVHVGEKVRVHAPLVTRYLVVYCIELINIFAVVVCVFKFFKLPTKFLPSDRFFWRGVCLGLLPSARIIAVALLILLL
jgi:hypothetical protein